MGSTAVWLWLVAVLVVYVVELSETDRCFCLSLSQELSWNTPDILKAMWFRQAQQVATFNILLKLPRYPLQDKYENRLPHGSICSL